MILSAVFAAAAAEMLPGCSAVAELAYDDAARRERESCDRVVSMPERQACRQRVDTAQRQAEAQRRKN